jgi:VCBS repeat-containing protein
MSVAARLLVALVATVACPLSFAQSYTHSVLIDADASTATGCVAGNAAGSMSGVEARLTGTIGGQPAQVVAMSLEVCVAGAFGAPQALPAGHPVGINNGVNGADVIELATAVASLPVAGNVRIGIASSSASGADFLGPLNAANLGTAAQQTPEVIPVLGGWGLLALCVVLGLALAWTAKRHRGLLSVLLVAGSLTLFGVVWAANYILDGQVGDWSVPALGGDAANDASSGEPNIDIVAAFAARESGTLFFRIDVANAQAFNSAPTIVAQGFSVAADSPAGTLVGNVLASDIDGDTLSWSIVSGNAGGVFAIDAATGALTVATAGVLDASVQASWPLQIQVSDDGLPPANASATITVQVLAPNGVPNFTSPAAVAVAENTAAVMTVTAVDPDGDALTYAIAGGADAALFTISSLTGSLAFSAAADFEAPTDADANNVYLVSVSASDGTATATQALTITVTDVNEAPAFTSPASANVIEGNTAVGTVTAVDPEGAAITYAISGGADAARFTIDAATGALAFLAAPDFAAPTDADGDNVYLLTVSASDGSNAPTQMLTVTVLSASGNAPVFTSGAAANVAENSTAVMNVTATDADGDALAYALAGGVDAALFTIDASTGALAFIAAPDFEAPTDAGVDNGYQLSISVSDGSNTTPQALTITVTDVNEAPTIADAAFAVAESSANGTVVGSVVASDPDAGQTLGFAITAGNTGGAFAIDASGQITVANGAALDAGVTPTFALTVTATDSAAAPLADSATVTITVTAVNQPPQIAAQAFAIDENSAAGASVGTVVASDPDAADALSFAITAGNTGGAFAIDAAGAITVASPAALDFETTPVFALTVEASDDGLPPLSSTSTITISLNDRNDAPQIADQVLFVAEHAANGSSPGTVVATDADAGQTLSFAIIAGSAAFAIDTAGKITVVDNSTLDFETTPQFALTVQVTDNGTPTLSATATITINLADVNDAPILADASFSIAENVPNGTVVATLVASDPDGDGIGYAITGGNAGGVFALGSASGVLTVADAAQLDFATTPTYTLTVAASDNGSPQMIGTATITVQVTDFDALPVAVNDAATVGEDSGTAAIDVLANDTDADGGPMQVQGVTQPAGASVLITGSGSGVSYTPNADFCTSGAADTFTYTLNGGSTATVSVTVTCVDDAPVAVNDSALVVEDAPATPIDVLANDTDVDGGPIAITSVTQPANASVVIIGGGSGLTYQPDVGHCNTPPGGPDTFTYTLTPGGSTATVSVTVSCDDDAPVAVDDTATVAEDAAPGAIDVLANDSDADGGPMLVQSVTQPANGSVAITGGGSGLTYAPAVNYCNAPPGNAPDTFTYTLAPGGSTATVSVTVTCVDDAPVAVNDSATVAEDSGANAINVLANDTDVDGGAISIQSVTQPASGTVVITGGGTGVTYAPNAEYCNTPPGTTPDTFTYTLSPGSSSATVSVSVTCVADDPTAVNDTATVAEDAAASAIGVLANDLNPDAGPISIQSVTQPANGAVVITGGGTGLTYAPSANYCNTPPGTTLDVFTYTLSPGGSTATVSVSVTCVDDAPVAVNDSATVAEDSGASAIAVLANDTDVDGGPMSIQSVTQPANGTVVITGGGSGLSYTPNANYCNTPPGTTPDTFTYSLSPGSSSASVSVTVTCVDDDPTAVADTATVLEDSGASPIAVLANDSDPDGGAFNVQSVTQPANGAVVITGGGTDVSYTPSANYCNTPPGTMPDTFTYTLAPGGSSAQVSVTVTCVNDPPAFSSSATPSVQENTTAVVTVVAADPDGDTVTYAITGGVDAGLFSIVAGSGVLRFNTAPDFEAPADAGANNVYDVQVTASDGSDPVVQNLAVSVTNANEAPVLDDQARSIAENSANTTAVGAALLYTDPDAGQSHTFSITAGDPAGVFAINATGQITVANSALLNFEAVPSFVLTVSVTDGALGDSATVTISVIDVNEAPVPGADSFSYVGNTELRIAGHAGTANALASTTAAVNLLANDTDPDGPASGFANLSVVAAGPAATAAGSVYRIESNGTMVFTPGGGLTSDSVTYQLTDGTNTVAGTISFAITGTDIVWYVRNNDPTADAFAGNDGTSSDPFNTLAAAQTASSANHIVYVHVGDGTTAGQSAGIVLKNNQKLFGNGVALVVNGATTLINAGSQPQIGNVGGIGVSAPNLTGTIVVRGLNVAGSTDAILATATGTTSSTIEIADNTIRSAVNQGIDVEAGSSGSVTLSVHDNVVTATQAAIELTRTAGTLTITAFDDNVVTGNSNSHGIDIDGAVFDTVAGAPFTTVSGGVTVVGVAGNPVTDIGVRMLNVTGDLSFTSLNIFNGNGAGLQVTGVGTFNSVAGTGFRLVNASNTDSIVTNGGPGVNITSATITLNPQLLTVSGSSTFGVSLNTVAGTFSAGASSSIASPTAPGGTAYRITASSVNATYNGSITATQGTGVSLTTNTGTYAFTGALTLSTAANPAFVATSSGTVSSTNTASTLTTTTATALNVANTSIGASNLVFRSITAGAVGSGPANGIVLNNTGTSGGLQVQGNSAGICGGAVTLNALGTPHTATAPATADCTGGTIQSTTAAGISLTNTANVLLRRMQVLNSGTDGIAVNTINGLTIERSFISDSSGGAGDVGIQIGDFSTGTAVNGTISILNSTVGPTPHDNVAVGIGSGTSTWVLADSVFTGSVLNSGINFEVRNATVASWILRNSVLRNQFADGIQMQPAAGVSATISDALLQNNTFQSNNIGMDLNHDGTSSVTYRVLGNTFRDQVAQPINLFSSAVQSPTTGGTLRATIDGNRIGDAAVAFSGSSIGNGIRVNINGGASGRVLVNNNIVRQAPNGRGIEATSRNGTGGLDITLTNNTVNIDYQPTALNGGFSLSNIFLQSNCLTPCNTLRSDVRNNTVPAVAPTGDLLAGQIALIETGASTLQLVDSTAPVSGSCATELAATNTGSTAANAGCSLISGPIATP